MLIFSVKNLEREGTPNLQRELSLPLRDFTLVCLSVKGESRHRDEHRLPAGTAAGYQHVGTRLL